MNAPTERPFALHSIDDDADLNPSANPTFQSVLDSRLSRRSLLRGGVGSAATAVLGSWGVAACGGGDDAPLRPPRRLRPLRSTSRISRGRKVNRRRLVVPAGYTATVLYALGDPLDGATPAYANDGTDTDFDNRAGDHHDGMYYFGLSAAGTPRCRQQRRAACWR